MDIRDRDKLIAAFDHMVDHVGNAIHEAEEALAPTVDEMVHNAQLLARDIYALSQEEAESLGNTLRRDIDKANRTLNQQGKELKEWLNFDLQLVEDRFIELIARAADKTWLDLRAFENENQQAGAYRSGDVCSAGSFSCDSCGHVIQLTGTGQIPGCPVCDHQQFRRLVS